MKSKINRLNALYIAARITLDEYTKQAEKLLRTLDWQKRIQYENMLLV